MKNGRVQNWRAPLRIPAECIDPLPIRGFGNTGYKTPGAEKFASNVFIHNMTP